MDGASEDHITQTALLDGLTSPRWKVMYYIHKSLNGRRDAKNNRIAGTFVEEESPWQFQADFVEQRAELMCRRITRDCPSDLLYYGRPLGLIACVQANLPAYEYWGKHGFCEYCWVERDGMRDKHSAATEAQLPAQDAIGLHNTSLFGQHESNQALPVTASITASGSLYMPNPIAAVNQLADPMPTTRSGSMPPNPQGLRTVATSPYGWPSLPHAASQVQLPAASLRPDQAVVDRRLAALRSSRANTGAMPCHPFVPRQEPFFWP
ncbi:hypothetical protein HII31_08865 [Pseudocercospora fuligena]|uniref:Uncharacterized protein n=1 Tax=Pseudocercospora fuligena TaxID=685502 RepID=A0A8H6RF13_9PEZI|nr:hypothetical protein HII31_08865 [Pseudocercospora fuligena]